MKKTVVFSIVICLFFLPTFSQLDRHFKMDTTTGIFLFDTNKNQFSLRVDTLVYKELCQRMLKDKFFLNPEISENNFPDSKLHPDIFENIQPLDNMPRLVPRGSYPMRIYKPDLGVRYSLLIKRH